MSVLMAMCMCFSLIPTANAMDATSKMQSLANEIITYSQRIDVSGTPVVYYSNIDKFVAEVKSTYQEITDYEIGEFILRYTGQYYDGLTEQNILDALTFQDMTSTKQYFTVDEEGNMQMRTALPEQMRESSPTPAALTEDDMSILTTYSKVGTDGKENIYKVWAVAEWINFPAICIKDAFYLGKTGTFDDEYTENGSVSQIFWCNNCKKQTYMRRNVDANNTVNGDTSMKYAPGGAPYLQFTPYSPRCDHCDAGAVIDRQFLVSIQYWMRADESVELQAGYAHTTFSVGIPEISVTIGATGVSFGFSGSILGTSIETYYPRAVTVRYE